MIFLTKKMNYRKLKKQHIFLLSEFKKNILLSSIQKILDFFSKHLNNYKIIFHNFYK